MSVFWNIHEKFILITSLTYLINKNKSDNSYHSSNTACRYWVVKSALSLPVLRPRWVPMGILLNLSVPQFPYLQNGYENCAYLIEMF